MLDNVERDVEKLERRVLLTTLDGTPSKLSMPSIPEVQTNKPFNRRQALGPMGHT